MAEVNELTELLRPHVKALENDGSFHTGERKAAARLVMRLYNLHRSCPSDPGAMGLCQAAFKDWQKVREDG